MLLKVKLQKLPSTALYVPFKATIKHLSPKPARFKTSKHLKMKEGENVSQAEENPKAIKATHSQDGFKNQPEESRRQKLLLGCAPQTSTTVPDHETDMAQTGQDLPSGAFPGGRLCSHTRCTQN